MSWALDVQRAKAIKAEREAFEMQKQELHKKAMAEDVRAMNIMAYQGDVNGVAGILESRVNTLRQQGGDATESLATLNMIRSGDPQQIGNAFADLAQADQIAVANGFLPPMFGEQGGGAEGAKKTSFTKSGHILQTMDDGSIRLTTPGGKALAPGDSGYQQEMSVAMQSGIAYAGDEAAAKAAGRNEADLMTRPQVEAAITAARKEAEAEADAKAKQKLNQIGYSVYKVAFDNVVDAFSDGVTGPGLGLLPAFTKDGQAMDKARALLAPQIRAAFRVKGEGAQSDKEMKLFLDMLPDRNTLPEVAARNLEMLDMMMRVRFGIPIDGAGAQAPAQAAPASEEDPLGIR